MKTRELVAAVSVAAVVSITGVVVAPAGASTNDKVGVCHRTASESNPYVYIEVPADEANGHITGEDKQHNEKVTWPTAGTWRGVPHNAGDLRLDYLAPGGKGDCDDKTPPPPPPAKVKAVAPTFTDPCGPDNEVLTLATTVGVTYTRSDSGNVITVTATSADPTKFKLVGQTVFTFTVNDVACPVVPPVVPPVVAPVVPPVVAPVQVAPAENENEDNVEVQGQQASTGSTVKGQQSAGTTAAAAEQAAPVPTAINAGMSATEAGNNVTLPASLAMLGALLGLLAFAARRRAV